MLKIYQEEMFLRTSMCDALGAWRPDAILECMQETAGARSALLGLGRDVMDRMGVCWILSRVKVEMHRVPHALEKITVETWPMPTRHLFFPRSHVFCDEKGDVIGCANSLWMVMDLESRRVVKNDFVAAHMPDTSDFKSAAGIPATVRAPVCPSTDFLATPKSMTLAVPSSLIIMFPGFKSQWIISCEWA